MGKVLKFKPKAVEPKVDTAKVIKGVISGLTEAQKEAIRRDLNHD